MSMTRLQRQLLTLITEPRAGIGITLPEWSEVILALRETDMLARVGYLASQAGCLTRYPKPVQRHIQSARALAFRQQQQACYEAGELSQQLADIGVAPLFLKGAAYSLLDNAAAQGRIYSDIDVLVPKPDLIEIQKKLVVNSWMPKALEDYDERYYRDWTHEIPPMHHVLRGTVADIHHNLIPPVSGKAPDIGLFTHNPQQTANGLLTLSTEGLILHSSIHLFYNEEFSHGFRDICDLHLLFNELALTDTCWSRLLKLAKDTGFESELYYAFRYCDILFHTAFPDRFRRQMQTIAPSRSRTAVADFILGHALLPQHKSAMTLRYKGILILALIRGHWLKMPLRILLPHLAYKGWKGVRDSLAGKHTFERAEK